MYLLRPKLEKLLQKNYFLHQSARDGYRSYLQAYASYSLKKIFDVNALDLAKVGKAFGFAVPPRVNINMGGGKGGAGRSGKKRSHPDKDSDGSEQSDDDEEEEQVRRRDNKQRRIETLGKKAVQKEVYKRSQEVRKEGAQWSR